MISLSIFELILVEQILSEWQGYAGSFWAQKS